MTQENRFHSVAFSLLLSINAFLRVLKLLTLLSTAFKQLELTNSITVCVLSLPYDGL